MPTTRNIQARKTLRKQAESLQSYLDMFNKAKEEKTLLVISERGSSVTYVVEVDEVHPKFVVAHQECFVDGDIESMPYTISFSDLLTDSVRVGGFA